MSEFEAAERLIPCVICPKCAKELKINWTTWNGKTIPKHKCEKERAA